MKLSIIVPVYNVEPYLEKCIDSILAQSVTDMEVILVDDGSTDGSAEACDRYSQKDRRIVVIHKENGGLSDARNAGLEIARGEYIGFVDSDDHIDPDMYHDLIVLAEKHDAQICSCGFIKVDGLGNTITKYPANAHTMVYSRQDFIDDYYPDIRWQILYNMCNKLFRRELFQSVRFPKNVIYEDAFVLLDLLDRCTTVVVSHQHLYYYVFRTGSIVNTGFSTKHFSAIDYCYKYHHFFSSRGLRVQAQYALDDLTMHYMQVFFAVDIRHKEMKTAFKPYKKRFAGSIREIMKDPVICKLKKVIVLLSRIHSGIAYKLCRKYFPEWLYVDMR